MAIIPETEEEVSKLIKPITKSINPITPHKTIKFKKLHPDAKPLWRTDNSEGWDLTTTKVEEFRVPLIGGGEAIAYKLYMGVAVEPPEGYYFDMRCRSSFSKTGWVLGNGLGTIDSDYRGELMAIIHPVYHDTPSQYNVLSNFMQRDCEIEARIEPPKVGERHMQLLLKKSEIENVTIQEVEELSETNRGSNGYGSSGK